VGHQQLHVEIRMEPSVEINPVGRNIHGLNNIMNTKSDRLIVRLRTKGHGVCFLFVKLDRGRSIAQEDSR
jgi:hypothetical protein